MFWGGFMRFYLHCIFCIQNLSTFICCFSSTDLSITLCQSRNLDLVAYPGLDLETEMLFVKSLCRGQGGPEVLLIQVGIAHLLKPG